MYLENKTVDDLTYKEAVDKIVNLNKYINNFWINAHGWAPNSAANLLSKSRLDWLLSLSNSLYKWESNPEEDSYSGDLILAWVNLGALTEGAMKFFLSVYYEDYIDDTNIIIKQGIPIDPDRAMFDDLRNFFVKSIWDNDEQHPDNIWLKLIQQRRNAIHAYQDKEINDFNFLREQVKIYLKFLMYILDRVPVPDGIMRPGLFLGYK